MPGNRKVDWKAVKSRYVAGDWINLTEAAKGLGLNYRTLRTRAAREHWQRDRDDLQDKAEEIAKASVLRRLTQEFEKSITRRLQSAEILRYKGMETLTQPNFRLSGNDAIRAIDVAASMENEIFTATKRVRMLDPDQDPDEANNATAQETPDEIRATIDSRLVRLAAGRPKGKSA